jgi:hypothetical protein
VEVDRGMAQSAIIVFIVLFPCIMLFHSGEAG